MAHCDWRVLAVIVPGAHRRGTFEPAAQEAPTGQAVHSAALIRFATFEYEPAGHGSSADAPSGQKLPPLQALHVTAPSSSWNEPAGHLVQEPALDASLNVPAAQLEALLEPVGLKEPGVVPVQSEALVRSVL